MRRACALVILLAVASACTFGSTGSGQGDAGLPGTATEGSGGADDGTASPGTTGGVGGSGEAGSGTMPGDGSGAMPGDGSGAVPGDTTTGGPPGGDTTTAATSDSGGNDDDDDPPSAGYGPCPDRGCAERDEVCLEANPYYVCSSPCEDSDDCPRAPAGTDAPPGCFDVGTEDDMCFLDCSRGAVCPAGMDCNPFGHCAWQ